MKTINYVDETSEEDWPVRPYYKRELAEAYAPGISPTAALNRLAKWLNTNMELKEALLHTNYRTTQKVFTSLQVAFIFEYLGKP